MSDRQRRVLSIVGATDNNALQSVGVAAAAEAQDTVRIAVPDSAGVKETTDFVRPIDQATGTTSFDNNPH